MTEKGHDRLAVLIDSPIGDLVRDLAEVAGVPIAVLDSSGAVAFDTSGRRKSRAAEQEIDEDSLIAPIQTGESKLGSLAVCADRPEVRRLVGSLASHLSDYCNLQDELFDTTDHLSHSYDEISLIFRLARVIRPYESLSANAGRMIEEAADLLDRRCLVVSIPEDDCFLWRASPGLLVAESVDWVLRSKSTIGRILSDIERTAPLDALPGGLRHQGSVTTPCGTVEYSVAPLRVRHKIAGFAGLFRTAADTPFCTGELQLVESLVQELSNAATTKKLNQELYELIFDVMRSLVAAIEARDEYTSGHSERVFRLSTLMAKTLGMESSEIRTLSWAALLHDIGKIAISDAVLRKASDLTDEEYRILQTHPARGCHVLEPIRQFSDILPGIRHHHERFDGGGYPDGLKGEEIPLIARIIGVADSFDAMMTARPYRPARTLEYALGEISSCAGTQFDPRMAEALLDLAASGDLAYSGYETAAEHCDAGREAAGGPGEARAGRTGSGVKAKADAAS